MTEIDRRISELCAAIAKENSPAATVALTAELDRILAGKVGDAAVVPTPVPKLRIE
jgi:hypothetical protein